MSKSKSSGKNKNTVVPYHKPLNVNIGLLFFVAILFYLIVSIFSYVTSEKIVGYEVKTGSLSANHVYRGIALREEEIVSSDYAGYVNYYNEEGDRIGKGNLVYTVDESGTVMDYINSQNAGESFFTDDDLNQLRGDIVSFTNGFSPENFAAVYDFKNTIRSTTQKISGNGILATIRSMDQSSLSGSIHYGYSPDTGDITFYLDGFENRSFADISFQDFDPASYNKTLLENGRLVSQGDPVFKLCTDENWSLVIAVEDEETADALEAMEYVRVRFLKNQYESWGKVSKMSDLEGHVFVNLAFTNSMVTFCSDRFVDIELSTAGESGLKVPNTAIVKSDFFLVPKSYLTQSGSERGVLKQTYTENGVLSTTFVAAPPYSETDTEYYLDQSVLETGDVLVRPDSSETFTVGKFAELIGVYNINKGYADFRLIDILYSNEEYSIVVPNTMYGLSEYDFIVLDASKVFPDQFIYQ